MVHVIYKIVPRTLWQQAQESGIFSGAPVDLNDGYIHFSTKEQVRETAAKHFAGQADLLLVAIDGDLLGQALKYEVSRGGALLPVKRHWLGVDARYVDADDLDTSGTTFPVGYFQLSLLFAW